MTSSQLPVAGVRAKWRVATGHWSLVTLLVFLYTLPVFGDDVGITEARLIEEGRCVYAMEADASPYLVDTIQRPVLPRRCKFVGKPERESVGPMVVVRYRFTTGDQPLSEEDELLLPWKRSGVLLTAHWLDGTSLRAFFDRGLAGISVPVSRLRKVDVSRGMLLQGGVEDALSVMRKTWLMHLLLVVACATLGSARRLAGLLLAFAAGHGLALVAADLGTASIPSVAAFIMMGVAVVLMCRASARGSAVDLRFWPVLLALGLLHGLGYAGPFIGQQVKLAESDLVTARFAFNATADLSHALLGVVAWGCMVLARRGSTSSRLRPVAAYACGGLAVALLLVMAPDVWATAQARREAPILPVAGVPGAGNPTRTASRPVDMTDPIMGFVTITAFEVRCEWLMRVRDLEVPATIPESGEAVLPVDVQADFKRSLERQFSDETVVAVDGQPLEPSAVRADFVIVGTYGVSTRTVPEPELIDAAVIGVSLAYAVDDAPSEISLDLTSYPDDVPSIPVAVIDPWGSTARSLTQESSRLGWTCRMAGFRRPVIRAVTRARPLWPVMSVGLCVVAVVMLLVAVRKPSWYLGPRTASLCCAAAMAVYPFIRVPAPAAWSRRAPAEDDTREALTKLLTNIYRAFDYRTEDAIYDQLEVSATGDQLAAIYLEHLRAMELENRGGARASVDNVEVQDIHNVSPSEEGFSVNAGWIVSGSVSHFGHTHYRKNRYNATVHIKEDEEAWKISGIEVKEEERVL